MMNSIITEGYSLVAVGEHYINEAADVVQTLRKFDDNRPVSLISHAENSEYATKLGVFDRIVLMDTEDPIYKECKAGFEKNCLHARICMDKYLVYDRTIVLDTDVLCIGDTSEVWNFLNQYGQVVQRTGVEVDPNWHWATIADVISKFGKNVPHSHGGFTYIDRTLPGLQSFYDFCRHVFYKYDEYGCKRWFRDSMTEEIIIALAFANENLAHHDFFESPIMTFSLGPGDPIPCYTQKALGRNVRTQKPIPFVHMCHAKKGSWTYESLKNVIMSR